MHSKVKIRIIPLNSIQQLPYLNLSTKFLPNLTLQCILQALPILSLTARKLPPPLKLTVSSLGGVNLIVFNDYCSYVSIR